MAEKQLKNYDKEDVPFALERVTQDGSGFKSEEDLPPGDFEKEDDES